MSETSIPKQVVDQSIILREKLKLAPFGVSQPPLPEIVVKAPEKPTDLPKKVENMLNKTAADKPTVIEK